MVTPEDEEYFLNPPPGSAAARAVEFGIDLTLTLENLRLTPEERITKLENRIASGETNTKFLTQADQDTAVILELEAILECQRRKKAKRSQADDS